VVGNKLMSYCLEDSNIHSFDDTNKSTIVRGESNFHQNVVDSNLPGISLTGQDTSNVMIIVYNNCVFHGNILHFIFALPTLK
jgi:hypothetical protein